MVWSRVLIAAGAAVALLAGDTRAQACPDGQFSVSVLDDPQVQCLAARPCSGVYGPQGLIGGVGACPSGTGCALLPHNPSVMGCVVAGRADVSYVNPDGSLTRGGVVISGPPNADTSANNNAASGGYTDPSNANNNANNGANNNANANNNGANNNNANNNGANNNGATNNGANANANGNSTVATTPTPGANTNVPTPAHVKPGDASTEDSKAPSPAASAAPAAATSTAPASSGKPGDANAAASTTDAATETPTPTPTETPTPTPTPSSTPASATNQQKALDNIEGGIASNRDGKSAVGGVGISSIIAIVVGCLAVVAVIAGVFVLRKKKEQALETPAGGALDDYMGAGGVTPKENVLLL